MGLLVGEVFDDLIIPESSQVTSAYMSVYGKPQSFTDPLLCKVEKSKG